MNLRSCLAATALLLLPTSHLLAQDPPALLAAPTANDTARMLAGLPPSAGSPLTGLSRTERWQRHAQILDTAWGSLEKNQLAKVRLWAKNHIPDHPAAKGNAFYMFSGPDFLYADAFFPEASTYIMCGMEAPGPIPDLAQLAPGALGGELAAVRDSIDTVLSFSFFRTKDMKEDLRNHTLSGTLPLIYLFMARCGKTLTDVRPVGLDAGGALIPRADGERLAPNTVPGARITFLAEGSERPRTLYYFSTDISDSGLKSTGFLKFCSSLAPASSCVKSASYLMHMSYFSTIRAFLLENSRLLVQDDSGIPCSFFVPETWQLRFFGSYPGPIPLFKEFRQPQLAEYYRTTNPVPLDFGIGYRHRVGESMLMVANRKAEPAPAASAPPPPGRAEALSAGRDFKLSIDRPEGRD